MRAAILLLVCAVSYASACASCGGSSHGSHYSSGHSYSSGGHSYGGHSSSCSSGHDTHHVVSHTVHHAPVHHAAVYHAPAPRASCRPRRRSNPCKKPCKKPKTPCQQLREARAKLKSLRCAAKKVKKEIIRCYGIHAVPCARKRKRRPRRRYCNRPTFNLSGCALHNMLTGGAGAQAAAYDPNDLTRGNKNFRDFICRFKQGKINVVGCPFARKGRGCATCGDNGPGFGAAFRLGATLSGVGIGAGGTGVAAPAAAPNPFMSILNAHARCGSCRPRRRIRRCSH